MNATLTAQTKLNLERNLVTIKAWFNKNKERFGYLADRWLDEREYEDFKTYEAELAKLAPKEWTITKYNKRPFGFMFTTTAVPGIEFQLYMNLRNAGMKYRPIKGAKAAAAKRGPKKSATATADSVLAYLIDGSTKFSWHDVVQAMNENGVKVKNWLKVRGLLQERINLGMIKRTRSVKVEEYRVLIK
jgi:hypothetical protein